MRAQCVEETQAVVGGGYTSGLNTWFKPKPSVPGYCTVLCSDTAGRRGGGEEARDWDLD